MGKLVVVGKEGVKYGRLRDTRHKKGDGEVPVSRLYMLKEYE